VKGLIVAALAAIGLAGCIAVPYGGGPYYGGPAYYYPAPAVGFYGGYYGHHHGRW
jgi:hypothetical protein